MRKERCGMRIFLIAGILAVMAGCAGGAPDITAEVEATNLATVRKINLFTPSLAGEKGELFNLFLTKKLNQQLADYLNPGARWTLTIVKVDYTTPHYKQKEQHYKLALEAELTDMHGKRGWHAISGTSEITADPAWSEERIRDLLVEKAVEELVKNLPLGRIEMGKEKLK